MKGMVFVMFEHLVTERFGDEMLDAVYADAGIDETVLPFVGPKMYPDALMFAAVGALSARTGVPAPALVRAFGRYLFPRLAGRYPAFMEGATDARSFLATVDGVIHVEVRKLEPGAELPEVLIEDRAGTPFLRYRSPRRLCSLAEGLLEGVGDWFGQPITYEHVACMSSGAPSCEWALQISPRA